LERRVSFLWQEPAVHEAYKTAVSLHGHTIYSQERLEFIAQIAEKAWLLRWLLHIKNKEALRESNVSLQFNRAYWTPPLTPSAAHDLERRQITDVLGLQSVISLTDHDNVQAPLLLRVHKNADEVPISTEWTVPYHGGELHLGLHNLPANGAEAIVSALNAYTSHPNESHLKSILAELHHCNHVLIVLNHPLWDIIGAGEKVHSEAVASFMAAMGQYVHAFELGGLRSWEENRKTYELAQQWNVAAIGGGDRHGAEPSAVVNLTNACALPEFVREVLRRQTHVLFMPQYAKPLWTRLLQVVLDATQPQPGHPLGTYWDERTFHPDEHGKVRAISELWVKRPFLIETMFAACRLLECAAIRRAVASHVQRRQRMPLSLEQEEA
jgi:hypothetical protein